MWQALLVVGGELALGFLSLDLIFRMIPLEAEALEARLRMWGGGYAVLAALFCAAGAAVQWRLAGRTGLMMAFFNWVPWFALWRFGMRKQFTFIYAARAPERKPGHWNT